MRFGRFVLEVFLAVAILGLLVYLLGNTRLTVRGSSPSDGSLTFETQFPNLSCRKTFRTAFPFVRLKCESENTVP
ncbi:hypothetical protein BH24DEI2_BH24DEI2_19840 [soil metagenome]